MNELIYRPQHKPKEELKEDFVIRLTEYEKLMASIKADKPGAIPQHIILQGQRGMGKTTLMWRVYYQVLDDYRKNGLVPVIFSEEQYSIRTLYKLWEQVARYLEDNEAEYAGIWYQMQDIQDRQDYEDRCFDLLREKVQKNKHRLLLLIDNFGVMVDKFSLQEQQRLREILTTFPAIKIIGGSAVVLESFYRYDKPFFDFFKILHVGALNKKEVRTLLLRLGEKHKSDSVKEIIEKQPGRIESMRILTGGVPRTIVLLFSIFLDNDHGNSIEDLKKLLDLVTPLYKHRMDELPPQQQEIVDKLALNWDGMSVAELVSKTRMESKAISAQLNYLVKSGVVNATKSTGKNSFYQLEERFFNIWYLMQHAPRSTRQKVLWLTRFLEYWCSGEVMETAASAFVSRLKAEKMHPDYVQAMTHAYARAAGLPLYLRDEMIESARSVILDLRSHSLPPTSGEVLAGVRQHMKETRYAEAVRLLENASLPDDFLNFSLGFYFEEMGKPDEAERCYLKGVKLGYVYAMFNLAILYEKEYNDRKKAEKYYLMAVKEGDVDAMFNLASLYKYRYKDYQKAEKYYLMAVEKGYRDAMLNLGVLYHFQYKDYRKAKKYYLMAIKKGHSKATAGLGILYETVFKDVEKAKEYYIMGIENHEPAALKYMLKLVIERNWINLKEDSRLWMEEYLAIEANMISKLLEVKFLLWLEEFETAALRLVEILPTVLGEEGLLEELGDIFSFSIAKGLKNYVYKLFQYEDYQLKDRLKVHYYALMKLMEDEYPNEIRKMGKELEEPVAEMVEYIRELESKYG